MGSFIDGASASDSGNSYVLGTAYRNTSFVIYEKTIQSLSDSPFEPSRSLFETTVITHEFGHILGLTNLGLLFKAAMKTQHMRSIAMSKVV
jgi:predicted Zn-dependent protease